MKEKEFDRIVRELQNGKRELLKRGITFCLSGRNNATGQTWYASNRERNMSDVKHTEERTETHACDNERTETHGDLISRQAAINRIRKQMDRPDTFGWWTRNDKIAEACYKIAIEILERLPSAQPELIKQCAYVRGFEQGRTQGMIDAQDLQQTCNKLATDCISRQATIDAIVKQSVVDKTVAKRVLAQLPSAEPHWIPVSERLPEKNGYYLITDACGDVEMSWFRYDFDEEEPEWWLNEYGFIDVVAWMPLPKPYKAGEE